MTNAILPPGPELARAVAEQVMPWSPVVYHPTDYTIVISWKDAHDVRWTVNPKRIHERHWHPHDDITQAMTYVVPRMIELGFIDFTISNEIIGFHQERFNFGRHGGNVGVMDLRYDAFDTPERIAYGICIAAKRACEAMKETG